MAGRFSFLSLLIDLIIYIKQHTKIRDSLIAFLLSSSNEHQLKEGICPLKKN